MTNKTTNFDDYQQWTRTTAVYPIENANGYLSNGLFAESGEIAEAIAKHLRGDYGYEDLEKKLVKELGDVLWFVARLSDQMGYSLSDIAEGNINKLESRKQREVLKGEGDDR